MSILKIILCSFILVLSINVKDSTAKNNSQNICGYEFGQATEMLASLVYGFHDVFLKGSQKENANGVLFWWKKSAFLEKDEDSFLDEDEPSMGFDYISLVSNDPLKVIKKELEKKEDVFSYGLVWKSTMFDYSEVERNNWSSLKETQIARILLHTQDIGGLEGYFDLSSKPIKVDSLVILGCSPNYEK